MKRRWLLWLLTIAFVLVVIARWREIRGLVAILAQGQWQWVLAAAMLQLAYYAVYAALFQAGFAAAGLQSRYSDLLPLTLGMMFVNVAAPSAGAGGAVLFFDYFARRGQSLARAAAGAVLVALADLGAFALVLMGGFAYLGQQRQLKPFELAAAAILLLLIAGLVTLLFLGLRLPQRLRQLLGWVQRLVNRLAGLLVQRPLLAADWADTNARDLVEAGVAISGHPLRLIHVLTLGVLLHSADLACLYTMFLAFHQPIQLGVLVAGYTVGILFWIVAITPQGIGAVEGAMTLVFTSMGVPAAKSLVIALAFRGLALWLPAAVGFVLLRKVPSLVGVARRAREVWSVRLAAILTALTGIVNVLSAVTPGLAERVQVLQGVLPLELRHGARLTTVLLGFALLVLSANLWRRKRVAWLLTIAALLVSIVSHLAKGLDYEEATLAGALVVILLLLRPHFHARSDWPSVQQGLRMIVVALAFTLVYGVTGFYFLDKHFSVNFTLGAAIRQTLTMFVAFYNPGLVPRTRFGTYFADSIYLVGAFTLGYALLMLIRPVLIRRPASSAERKRAQAIVEQYGCSSLASLALLDDKFYYFIRGGSVLAFTVKGRTALVLGDPIGPEQDLREAIAEFSQHCIRNDWQPAFFQAMPEHLPQYRALGFDAIAIGQEAIADLAKFTLAGRANHDLRSAVNRITKHGYHTEYHEPPLSDHLLVALRVVSDEWLTMVQGSEKRFFLGWFDDDYVRNGPVMAVYGPDGTIKAFANIVPEYQLNEATIDLMRHVRQTENGIMDYLFVSLFQWAQAQGYATSNLGLSSLAGIGERPDDPAAERALHFIYERVDEPYDFKGLYDFKNKFHPIWSPRYLVYPGAASLPAVAMAIARAYTGDRFLRDYVSDFAGRLLHRQLALAR